MKQIIERLIDIQKEKTKLEEELRTKIFQAKDKDIFAHFKLRIDGSQYYIDFENIRNNSNQTLTAYGVIMHLESDWKEL